MEKSPGTHPASRLIRELLTGLIATTLVISIALSFATLIFRDELEPELIRGAGWALAGVVALSLVVGIRSSLPGMVSGPQDVPAVLVASVGAALVNDADAPVETLAVFVIVSSLVTGLTLVLLGRFGLGTLLRYLPFPVVAGFLAGTGIILIRSSLAALVSDAAIDDVDLWARLGPGVALAVGLVVAGRLLRSPVAPALMLLVVLAGHHLVAGLAGTGRSEAIERGLVLGPFPSGRVADLDVMSSVGSADWGALVQQLPALAVMALIVPLALMLNTGGVEQTFGLDVDVDRELEATGTGLIIASPFAGLAGYVHLGSTVLSRRLAGPSRVPAIVVAAAAGACLLGGADLLSFVPVSVTAGVLLFIGLDFVVSWLWLIHGRVSRFEHALAAAIAAAVAVLGFLPGVGLGLLAASILFVVRYSRVPSVRVAYSGQSRRSNVQRADAENAVLTSSGDELLVIELQGFLFFGTAEQVVNRTRVAIEDEAAIDSVIIDCRRVTGLDSSAMSGFERLARLAEDRRLSITFCGSNASLTPRLATVAARTGFHLAPDLDHALEQWEDEALARAGRTPAPADEIGGGTVAAFRAGETIIRVGERDAGIFYLVEGRASVARAPGEDGGGRRRVLLPGTFIGELSHVTASEASATVVCDTDCELRHLSKEWLDELAVRDPTQALIVERLIARHLAETLKHADHVIQALQ